MDNAEGSDADVSLSKKIRDAVINSQQQVLTDLDSLISSKLDAFETRMTSRSEEHISVLQSNLTTDVHKFSKKSCEDQFKFNNKLKAKLVEVERATQFEPMSACAKISEGMAMLDYRQKLIKLADTSEAGWKAVDEYVANPIASDSEDEKKMERATSKANRKLKAAKVKPGRGGRGRSAPYPRRIDGPTVNTQTSSNPDDRVPWRAQRPGLCHRYGKPGHWRLECPGVSGGASLNGNKLSTIYFCKHVQSDSSVHDIKVITPLSGTGESYVDSSSHVRDRRSDKVNVRVSPVGRLRNRLSYWRKKGTCEAVLAIVSDGYKVPFREIPTDVILLNNKSARDNPEFVESKIGKLLELGCIVAVTTPPHVVNPLTVAYNRTGKPRLVLDCRHINQHLHAFKFKYEDARTARDMFTTGEFLFTYDLKSAFHHVEIFSSHRTYLGFSWKIQGQTKYYVYNVLPFGIATAGYVFSKVLREVVKHVRAMGHKLIMYLDDGIGGHKNLDKANELSRYVQKVLSEYGFLIADEKCQWGASQFVTWLGYTWSMAEGVVRVTEARVERLYSMLAHTLTLVRRGHRLFTVRYVASMVGKIISMQSVEGMLARLRTRQLYNCVLSRASWNAQVVLSDDALAELENWLANIHELNNKGSKLKETRVCTSIVCTDASGIGYGGFVSPGVCLPFEACEFVDKQVIETTCDGSCMFTQTAGPLTGTLGLTVGA